MHIGLGGVHGSHAFRGGNHNEQANVFHARLSKVLNRGQSASARSQHWVNHEHHAILDALRHFCVIGMWLVGLFVSLHAEHAHSGRRNNRKHALEHTHACTKNGNHGQGVVLEPHALGFANGGFHLHLQRGQIARRLIGLERRELVDKLAEVRGGGAFVAQNRHLMADQRVVEHGKAILVVRNVGHGLILSE